MLEKSSSVETQTIFQKEEEFMFDFTVPETKSLNDLLSLQGKVAIVTGGSRGIGKQIVSRFTEAGANVVITGRGLEALQKVEAEFRAKGFDVTHCQADVSNIADSQKVIDLAVKTYGRLDILVNNAASFPFCDALSMTEEVWDKCFDTDAKGTFFMSKFAAEQMIKQKQGGRIINFMSTAALNPSAPLIAYGAAKQAVWYVTRTMAQEFAPYGITVNAATPGATMTEERMAVFGGDRSQLASFIEKSGNSNLGFVKNVADFPMDKIGGLLKQAMPMGRTGFPDDLAKAVLFLASDMGEYITGQNITADGAQSIQNPMTAMMNQISGGFSDSVEDTESEEGEPAESDSFGAAVSVSGTWVSHMETPMGKNELTMVLMAEGNALTGSVSIANNTMDIEKGNVAGDTVSFQFKMKAGMMKAAVKVSGKVCGNTLSGEIKLPIAALPFTAERTLL